MVIGVRDLSLNCVHCSNQPVYCISVLRMMMMMMILIGVRDLIYHWVVIFPLLSFFCSLSLQ